MKKGLLFFIGITCLLINPHAQGKAPVPGNDRKVWLFYLDKMARPVLSNLAAGKLKEKMPQVLSAKTDNKESRTQVMYLEAFGRVLCGIAPWLNADEGAADETAMRNQYRQWAVQALANAVNPASKDYLRWNGGQPLVDASFLALALIRCPWLWNHTDSSVRAQLVTAFKTTRSTVPVFSNWILFSGMIEAFFCKYGMEYDPVRIEYGIRQFAEHW